MAESPSARSEDDDYEKEVERHPETDDDLFEELEDHDEDSEGASSHSGPERSGTGRQSSSGGVPAGARTKPLPSQAEMGEMAINAVSEYMIPWSEIFGADDAMRACPTPVGKFGKMLAEGEFEQPLSSEQCKQPSEPLPPPPPPPHVVFPEKPQEPPLPKRMVYEKPDQETLQKMAPYSYLIATGILKWIRGAIQVTGEKRPRVPFMDPERCAALFMGYYFKTQNMNSPYEIRQKYRKAMFEMSQIKDNSKLLFEELNEVNGSTTNLSERIQFQLDELLGLEDNPEAKILVPTIPEAVLTLKDTVAEPPEGMRERVKALYQIMHKMEQKTGKPEFEAFFERDKALQMEEKDAYSCPDPEAEPEPERDVDWESPVDSHHHEHDGRHSRTHSHSHQGEGQGQGQGQGQLHDQHDGHHHHHHHQSEHNIHHGEHHHEHHHHHAKPTASRTNFNNPSHDHDIYNKVIRSSRMLSHMDITTLDADEQNEKDGGV